MMRATRFGLFLASCFASCIMATWGLAASGEPTTLDIGSFENGRDGFNFHQGVEFPGAKGSFTIVEEGKVGKSAARLACDFTSGGQYVFLGKSIDAESDFEEVLFWVKSSECSGLTFRLVDKTGQVHQQRPKFAPNAQWQLVTIKTFNQGPGYQTWGGVGDRRWHAPARSLALILERETLRNAKGAVLIDGIEAVLDLRPIVPLLEVAPTRQGNVFLNNEEIAIPVQTKGDRIRWTVTDFFENIVARGEEPVVDTRAVIRPPVEKGYFLIELEAIEKGEAIGTARVPLGVITLVGRETMQDNRFGVMTHFAQGWDVDIMPLIAKAGIGSIRDEQYWAQVEKRRGEYAFSDKFTHYMAVAEQYGIRPLVPMTFSNKLYDEGLTPHTSEACDAYGRYGQAILNQYGDQIEWLEIWNEYNGTWCKGPAAEDRPKYYTQMLKHAYQRIKEVRPDVKVLGCATVVVPLPYLEGIFKHGGLDYMDAVVIHPYREQPEGVEDDVAELQEMIRMYNDGEDKPIWVTETGTFDRSEYDWELGKETYELGRRNAARYLVRQNVLLLSQDVEKIYWYLARDYNEFLTMGLLRSDKDPMGRYAVAPNYVAYATLIRQLHGARFARREPTQPHARVYLFQRESEQIRVCWATQPVHVALKTQSPVTVVDMMGGEETLFPTAGEISLTLNENPVYVRGAADTIGDSSVFQIEAEQDVDILNDVALQFTLDNSKGIRPLSGHIELQDRRFPVEVEPQSRLTDWLVIPAQDTSQARSHGLWYRLVLDGKPAAKGRILAHVVDPLSFSGRPQMIDDDVLQLRMANGSLRNDYQLTAVRWKCGDKNGTQEFNATLPHGQSLVLNMPFDSLPNYRALPVEIEAAFADRASLGLSAEVANAPCVKATIKVDGDLTDWQAIPSIDLDSCGLVKGKATVGGKAQIAWDDAHFYLAASVEDETFAQRHTGVDAVRGDCLRFALAPAFAGNWCQRGKLKGWYEYVAAVTPDGPQLACTLAPESRQTTQAASGSVAARRVGQQIVYEIAIPWAAMNPVSPTDRSFRLSLLVGDSDDDAGSPVGWIGWGGGIGMGKTPDAFRICRFVIANSTSKMPQTTSLVQPLDGLGDTKAAGTPVADSATDYSNKQGANNWFYGFYAGDGAGQGDGDQPLGPYTDDDFGPMTHVQTVWGYNWAGPAKYLSLKPEGGHPEVIQGRPAWAVRRWKSTVSGPVRLVGFFRRTDEQGDGTGGRILIDGVQVYETTVGGEFHPGEVSFDVVVPVHEGSLIDFAITPGPTVDTQYDATQSRATIYKLQSTEGNLRTP